MRRLILWCPGLKGDSAMAMGQQKDRQGDLMVSWSEMPRSPGHVFYDRLQSVLIEGGFDAFAEATCKPYYAARMGAPSVPPGRYFCQRRSKNRPCGGVKVYHFGWVRSLSPKSMGGPRARRGVPSTG